jgi:outer membrane protein assembly factor BamB
MLAAQQESAAAFANRNATVVAAPPWDYTLRKKVAALAGPAPTLKLVSEAKNAITDDADWFARHQVELQEYEVPNPMRGEPGNLPPSIPPTYGKFLLVQAVRQADLNVLFYGPDYSGGRFVAVQRGGEIVALLDFAAWEFAPEMEPGERMFVDQRASWAAVDGGVLYVSHGHRTYAKSSKGKNAYVSALDLASGELLWRSAPLVANSANFVIAGGHIVAGYGFTAEPDFLYVLDRSTGKTVGKTKVKSGPDYLFLRSGKLYVRCYDTDYVFELRQGGG